MHACIDTEKRLNESAEEEPAKRQDARRQLSQQGSIGIQHKRGRVEIAKVGTLEKEKKYDIVPFNW
eukprot:9459980-Pyramimonas_sp.AAC.1